MNNMPQVLKFLEHIQVLQTSMTRKKQYKMGAHGPVISKFNLRLSLSSKMNNMPQVVMFSDYIFKCRKVKTSVTRGVLRLFNISNMLASKSSKLVSK
jgi:hypothetical protein